MKHAISEKLINLHLATPKVSSIDVETLQLDTPPPSVFGKGETMPLNNASKLTDEFGSTAFVSIIESDEE